MTNNTYDPPVARATTDNRLQLRKWLTGLGAPSSVVRCLRLNELQRLIDDEQAVTALLTDNEKPPRTPVDAPKSKKATDVQTPSKKPRSGSQGDDLGDRIAKALAPVFQNLSATVDEAQVIKLIHEHAPKASTTTLRIETPREVRTIDEHTHDVLPTVIQVLNAGVNVYMVGGAGSGKTTIARQAATALGLDFYFQGSVQSKYDLIGYTDAMGDYVTTDFRRWYEGGGVFLLDEIDGSQPDAVVAFNAAMEDGYYSFPDKQVKRHKDCKVIAAANTFGIGATNKYVGRYALDAASLSRFFYISVTYDEKLERSLVQSITDNETDSNVVLEVMGAYRKAIVDLGLDVICGTREIKQVAQLVSAGMPMKNIIRGVLDKGLGDEHFAQLKATAQRIYEQQR